IFRHEVAWGFARALLRWRQRGISCARCPASRKRIVRGAEGTKLEDSENGPHGPRSGDAAADGGPGNGAFRPAAVTQSSRSAARGGTDGGNAGPPLPRRRKRRRTRKPFVRDLR